MHVPSRHTVKCIQTFMRVYHTFPLALWVGRTSLRPQCPRLSSRVAIMPVASPFSQVTSARHQKRRLGDVEVVEERYEAQLQPHGSILLMLAGGVTGPPVEPDYKADALCMPWRMRSMQVSRGNMAYLLPNLDSPLSWADVVPWVNKLSEPTSRGTGGGGISPGENFAGKISPLRKVAKFSPGEILA